MTPLQRIVFVLASFALYFFHARMRRQGPFAEVPRGAARPAGSGCWQR
jgi:hypothetical protein